MAVTKHPAPASARRRQHWWALALPAGLSALFAIAAPATAQHLLHGASGLDHGVPDLCAKPTISAARSGAWSAPGTWSPARVPHAGDRVAIGTGVSVAFDVAMDEAIACVGIDGALAFRPDVDTRLIVGDLLVRPSGTLEIGTEETPIAPGRTATVVIADKAIDAAADPEQFGTGLIGMGRVRMHGEPKGRTFLRLGEEAQAGGRTIVLSEPEARWRAGDRLLFPDSRYLRGSLRAGGWSGIEVATLEANAGNRLTVSALRADHPGARNADGQLEFLPHVANLSRNVVIRSANPAGTRGHVIFVARADVDIRYAQFLDLGRTTIEPIDTARYEGGRAVAMATNQIGRYAVHFHHVLGPAKPAANGHQFTFVGNVVEGARKWGLTIHRTHYGLARDNVLYDTHGAAIMAEDGSESFNVIERNFVVKVGGDGNRGDARAMAPLPDFAHEGTGIWLRGPNNYVRGNVVANAIMYGYMLFYGFLEPVKIPEERGGEPRRTVDFSRVRGLEFTDNESYASSTGATIWYVDNATLTRMRVWHVLSEGLYGYPSSRVVLEDWVVRGDPAAVADDVYGVGMTFGDYPAQELTILRPDIQNMPIGIQAPLVSADITKGPSGPIGVTQIVDGLFRNARDIEVATPYYVGGLVSQLPGKTTIVRNSRFPKAAAALPAERRSTIAMAFTPRDIASFVMKDRVVVYDFDAVPGDNFEVFYREQAPDFVMPAQGYRGNAEAGLTNADNWARHRTAIAGQVAPCTTARDGIAGFACKVVVAQRVPPPVRNVVLTH